MSSHLTFAYPGDIETRTGGYGYDRRVVASLRDLGWKVDLVSLGNAFPNSQPENIEAAGALLSRLPDDTLVLVDGLAFGMMDAWATGEAKRLKIMALVHHPLALETGLDDEQRTHLADREKAALSHVRGVIVTSHMTATELAANYGVPSERIAVAMPGMDPGPLATGGNNPPLILSVGTLTRRKGHDVLIAALARLRDLRWTCRIVGNKDLDPKVTDELQRQIAEADLTSRIELVGQIEDPRTEFAKADIFALASRYEGYGMVFAEALAQGLPIVGCAAGAVPDVVPESAGILVAPNDPGAFAEAIGTLLTEPEKRIAMADAAAVAGARLPSWHDTAKIISSFLKASS